MGAFQQLNMKRLLIFCFALFAFAGELSAQKTVWLTGDEPYIEGLQILPDSTESDASLKIEFNEPENTVTVSLSSERNHLFAFHESVRYKDVFKCCRKLKPHQLPYNVELEEGNSFRMTHKTKKSLGRHSGRYVFRPWMGLEGGKQSGGNFKLPEDSLVGVIKVNPFQSEIVIRLRDIMVIRHKGSNPRQWKKYDIVSYKALDAQYDITLVRNPCLGKEREVSDVDSLHNALSDAIAALQESFPGMEAKSLESFDNFYSLWSDLVKKFNYKDTTVQCGALLSAVRRYNSAVDSLMGLSCTVASSARGEIVSSLDGNDRRIDVPSLLYRARQLDELAARWPIATTKSEKLDILQRGGKIMEEAAELTLNHLLVTDADKNAMELFRQAKEYFTRICKY